MGKPVSRLLIDLGKDYTLPLPPRGPLLGWGSTIESQYDFHDSEGPGCHTRPNCVAGATVRAELDHVFVTWPDSGLTSLIRLTAGATVSFE